MSKKFKFILPFFLILVAGLASNFALAADFGLNEVSNTVNLGQGDPRVMIGRVIQIALTFLGVIALILMIYAGFLWMTSSGEEEKISQAKRILRNALIGLIIIMSAWGIATFVLNKLMEATGGSNVNYGPGSNTISRVGLGAVGACTVEGMYPENSQKGVARNTSIMATFKEAIKADSVCVSAEGDSCVCNDSDCVLANPEVIRLYESDLGDACSNGCPETSTNVTDLVVEINDEKTLIISPLSLIGGQSNNVWYTVEITGDLKKEDGKSMFRSCSSDKLRWEFEVSTSLDLVPPVVKMKGIFPEPDNYKDVSGEISPAVAATGAITVNGCPQTYSSAKLISVSPETATVELDYHGTNEGFQVSVPADSPNKAQLFNTRTGDLLGVVDFNEQGEANFPNYLKIVASEHPVGSLWSIVITPEILADSLQVGSKFYTFAHTPANNNIFVNPSFCNTSRQAISIQAKLSSHPEINVDRSGKRLVLTAKVAGETANSMELKTTDTQALHLEAMSGGVDFKKINKVNGSKDNPMNTVIQINFNEAINPISVSGTADELADYIRVVNADPDSIAAGGVCTEASECRSYSCENSACQGNYLEGNFFVSNAYKTVEFVTNNECGVNGCGEKIYCLPANSHLAVELMAANFLTCDSDADCSAYNPYKTCAFSELGYKTCQDYNGKNYPVANVASLDGIIDTAINSLDGNRDDYADGPIDFFNQNDEQDITKKDKYKFSFHINDQIALDPPRITAVNPIQGEADVSLAAPIEITFNTLMMNSSLRSGSVTVDNGQTSYEHKLVNLRSAVDEPLGYWIDNKNVDINPLDGVPDITITSIKHSPFSESVSYRPQVGSGVKDIYQNCFKPSAGPSCVPTEENPSCCFGAATNNLDTDGNCQ